MKHLLYPVLACLLAGCMGNLGGEGEDGGDDAGPDQDGAADVQVDAAPDFAADSAPDIPGDPPTDPVPDLSPDEAPEIDVVPDIDPDLCIAEGCMQPSDGSVPCCPGLSPYNDCLPGDESCAGDVLFCIRCGDGVCDPHEHHWNCPGDCPDACPVEAQFTYACGGLETWDCTCIEDPCKPRCSVSPPLWYNPCTGASLGACLPGMGVAECVNMGTDDEGWYDLTLDFLIVQTVCQPRWRCVLTW
jgi:hypothetical protein